ncbi:hypothetical protein [Nocardioides kribbensis]|uniref:hypothetical protein n=1 Tax=Nocardioides kribbensis TaxID=305517 RepID=UPI0032DB7514
MATPRTRPRAARTRTSPVVLALAGVVAGATLASVAWVAVLLAAAYGPLGSAGILSAVVGLTVVTGLLLRRHSPRRRRPAASPSSPG